MRLSHNLASLEVFRQHCKNSIKQSEAMSRISSGRKVNTSADNPNAMAKSENLRLQVRGLQMASRNAQDGVSMLQVAEGGIEGITSSLQRVRELLVQAGGATTKDDRDIIQAEIDQMIQSAGNMAENTEFNGNKLLNNSIVGYDNTNPDYMATVTGANVGEKMDIPMFNLSPKGLGIVDSGTGKINVDVEDIGKSLDLIDTSLGTVLSARSKYGALENRFESTYSSLEQMSERVTSSESLIRDADIAEEMINVSRSDILIQAGTSIMAQTNKFPQDILRILENVRGK